MLMMQFTDLLIVHFFSFFFLCFEACLFHWLWKPAKCAKMTQSPRAKDVPASRQQRSLGERGGGCQGEEMKLGGGGGQGGKTHVLYLKYLLSEKKFTGLLHLNPTHISFWIAAIINTLVIRVALSMIDSRWKKSAHLRDTVSKSFQIC